MKIFFAPSTDAAERFINSHNGRNAEIIADTRYTFWARYMDKTYDIREDAMYRDYSGNKCDALLVCDSHGLSLEHFLNTVCQCAARSGISMKTNQELAEKYNTAALTAGKPFEVFRANMDPTEARWDDGVEIVKALMMHFKKFALDEEDNRLNIYPGEISDESNKTVDITSEVRLTREWIETDAPEKKRLASEFDKYIDMAKESLEASLAMRKNNVSLYLTSAPAIGGHMVSYIRERYPDMFPDKNNIVMLYNSDTTALSICCIDHPDYRNPYGDEVKEGDELPELGFKFFEHSPEAISFSETGSSSVLGGVSPIDVRQIFNFLAAGYRYGVPGSEIDTNDRDSMSLPKHADFKFLVRDAAMWESPTDFDLS